LKTSELEELVAKTVAAGFGDTAAYAGGTPALGPVETNMPMDFGRMVDINLENGWLRLLLFITPDSTYTVGLMDLSKPPEHGNHFDWTSELAIISANCATKDLPSLFGRFSSPGVTKYPPAGISGVRKMVREFKMDTIELIAQTVVYRKKNAAVAWTGDNTSLRGLRVAEKMGLKIELRNDIAVAVLNVAKQEE